MSEESLTVDRQVLADLVDAARCFLLHIELQSVRRAYEVGAAALNNPAVDADLRAEFKKLSQDAAALLEENTRLRELAARGIITEDGRCRWCNQQKGHTEACDYKILGPKL